MDWALVIWFYFRSIEGDAVTPPDFGTATTYADLERTWRDERTLPSDAVLTAWYNDTGAGIISAWEQARASVPTVAELQAQVALLEQAMLDMLEGGL